MLNRISHFLDKSDNAQADQRTLFLIFQSLTLILVLGSSALIIESVGGLVLGGFVSLLLVSLVFTYLNRLGPARIIVPTAAFLLTTQLVLGGGVHDDAVGGYYFILMIAGLLLGQRAMLVFGVLSTLAVIAIGLAETNGLIATRFGPLTEPATIATTAFFLIGTTLAVNYLIIRLNYAIQRAQTNETAQIKANTELRELQAVLEERVAQRTAELDYATQQLMTQMERINSLQAKMKEEAIRDALTGLFNRRHLGTMLPIELARAKRANGPLTILLLDIDHFKNINDTYGHQMGDSVLQAVATTLLANVRIGDIVCRYGGEEFILVFPGMQARHGQSRAELLRARLGAQTIPIKDQLIQVTVSIGGSVYPQDGLADDDLISHADQALYRAKQNGRNRVEFAEALNA